NNSAQLKIQDQYQGIIGRPDMDAKWGHIEALLEEAQTATDNRWYINFTSGTGYAVATWPSSVAEGTFLIGTGQNDRLYTYLSDLISGNVGTILMDFPEYPDYVLITQVIDLNLGKPNWLGNKQISIPSGGSVSSSPSAVSCDLTLYCFFNWTASGS